MNSKTETESYRKYCLKQQTELRKILSKRDQFNRGIEIFLDQHAMLHSGEITEKDTWSFPDAILNDMEEEQIRRIPRNGEHSIAWVLWHIARIEDMTMNLLVAGRRQVFLEDNWQERLKSPVRHSGNELDIDEVVTLSQTVDIDALRAYRLAVGRQTRKIVRDLDPEDLKRKVDSVRLQRVSDEGAVIPEAQGILDYWSKRNIAGLLLMPATRHNLVHLNEAWKIKQKRQ